jgi:hypothetical protein
VTEKSAYIWNAAADRAGRTAKRDQLLAIGCNEVFVKGFGDDGVAWIAGGPLPDWARPQWSDAYAADYAPLTVTLWGYPWPRDSDIESLIRALRARWSPRVILNPETEWRWQNSNANPWNSLAEANAAATDWMRRLKARCQQEFGRVPSFWCSSCPSWYDFPYEGFMAECDGALPEHYFFEEDMARGEDMVEAHIRRAGRGKPCVPTLTACREYDDQGVVELAKLALRDYPRPAGFSAWEAGNGAFQAEAMRQAYALLPAPPTVEHKDDLGPAIDPGFPGVIQPDGSIVINGETVPDGVAVSAVALEITVRNAEGATYANRWSGHRWAGWRLV